MEEKIFGKLTQGVTTVEVDESHTIHEKGEDVEIMKDNIDAPNYNGGVATMVKFTDGTVHLLCKYMVEKV